MANEKQMTLKQQVEHFRDTEALRIYRELAAEYKGATRSKLLTLASAATGYSTTFFQHLLAANAQ